MKMYTYILFINRDDYFYGLNGFIKKLTPQSLERPKHTLLLNKHSLFIKISALIPSTSLATRTVVLFRHLGRTRKRQYAGLTSPSQ